MSRLAKKAIEIPAEVSVKPEGNFWIFKGPKGEVKKNIPSYIGVEEKDDEIWVSLKSKSKDTYAMLGTSAALIKNCIKGVTEGFEKKLEIDGIGYKAQLDGGGLVLSLGFTHPVKVSAAPGISFKVDKNIITVGGSDKEMVGRVAAEIRAHKPPEPYKGKGIHYVGEVIRRKAGKKAVAAA